MTDMPTADTCNTVCTCDTPGLHAAIGVLSVLLALALVINAIMFFKMRTKSEEIQELPSTANGHVSPEPVGSYESVDLSDIDRRPHTYASVNARSGEYEDVR